MGEYNEYSLLVDTMICDMGCPMSLYMQIKWFKRFHESGTYQVLALYEEVMIVV